MNSRKIILLIIVFQLFYCLANAQIKLVGNITTSGVANYPTHIDSLSKGGYMSMPDIAARDAIPALRRKYGMLVFVQANGIIYKLNAATLANADWVIYSLGATADVDAGTLTGTTLKSTITNSSLTSLGTIATGVWSGTAVAIAKGGTGLTAAGTNGQILTSTSAGTLTWTTPSTTSTPDVFLPTVVIGTQQWMEKNLDVMTYRDGTVIPEVTGVAAWAALTTGAWCWYSNSAANGAIYGKLYNWYAVMGITTAESATPTSSEIAARKKLAPQGWHIPTDAEWTTLSTLLGGETVAGGKMKTTGTTIWTSPNTSATNESGFAGLPGGYRYANGTFLNVGDYGYWWSATQDNSTGAWIRGLYSNNFNLGRGSASKSYGFSIRCLRD